MRIAKVTKVRLSESWRIITIGRLFCMYSTNDSKMWQSTVHCLRNKTKWFLLSNQCRKLHCIRRCLPRWIADPLWSSFQLCVKFKSYVTHNTILSLSIVRIAGMFLFYFCSKSQMVNKAHFVIIRDYFALE